ncbi:MAG: hypothetical protein ACI8Y4_004168 [Candidatus Poriferisodalaceae bacterium]|jgi:hypothetical protein
MHDHFSGTETDEQATDRLPAAHRSLLVACTSEPSAVESALERCCDLVDLTCCDETAAELLPLLYRQLCAADLDHPARSVLAACYRESWRNAQQLIHNARPFFERLDEAGYPSLVLKGGAFATATHHGDVGVRPIADLDVMIPTEALAEIISWAFKNDWRLVGGTPWSAEQYISAHHAVDLCNAKGGALDVHHHLLSTDRSPDLDRALFGDAVETTLGDVKVSVLSPTHQMSHTLAHAKPEGLRHVADAIWLIRRHGSKIDWAEVSLQLSERRSLSAALHALELVSEVDPTAVPTGIIAGLRLLDRHWSDWDHQTDTVETRRDATRVFFSRLAQQSRGASPGAKLAVGWQLARLYAAPTGSVGRKALSMVARSTNAGRRTTPGSGALTH